MPARNSSPGRCSAISATASGGAPILLFCAIAFGLDYLFMAAAPTLAWLFLGRLIAGVAGATYGPANAVLADVTVPEKRGAVFGLMGAAFGLGFILGPAIGGLMAGFGTRAPFIVAAALAGTNALWIALRLPETLPLERRRPFRWRDANIFGAFKPLFHAGGAAPLLVAALFWQLAHFVYPATWALLGRACASLGRQSDRLVAGRGGAAMALAQTLVTGRAIARYGEARTVVIGMIVGGTSFLLYVFARDGWQVYAIIFFSALQGLVYPSMNALLSRMTDASHQGALQGGMASIASIAAIFGPLAMTQALAFGAEHGEPGGAFLLAAMLVFTALMIVIFGVVRRLRPAMTVATDRFAAPDGVSLAWHELGEGRAVVLLHGLFSDAATNWLRYGHAARPSPGRGFRVIMPDLRAHGASDKPHDPAAYPPDILANDGLALIAHLGLKDYDLGGYSLGGRTAIRMAAKGAAPRGSWSGGMGLEGIVQHRRAQRPVQARPDRHRQATSAARRNGWRRPFSRLPAAIRRRCCLCSTASSIPASPSSPGSRCRRWW